MWNKKNLFWPLLAAMLLMLPACGDKGGAKPEKKEAGDADKKEAAKAENQKGRLVLSPEATKNAGIKVDAVSAQALPSTIRVTANITHNQDRMFHVTPRVRGRVVEVSASVGSAVKTGSPLALLDSTELGEARAEYAKARVLLDLAKANVEREKRLFEQKISPQKDLLTAQAEEQKAQAEARMLHEKLRLYGLSDPDADGSNSTVSRYLVRAPGPGVVVEKEITQGEVIEAGKKVFTVSDLSTVWVLLNVFEKDLAQVSKGATVKIQTEPYPGEMFEGKVAYVGDVIDPQNRTAPLRVEVPNPSRRLKPGMFATAEVVTGISSRQAILIPAPAIQKIEGKAAVFVQQQDGSFVKRDVELGREFGGRVEVQSGLKEGEQVVTDGSFTLKSELLKAELAGHED